MDVVLAVVREIIVLRTFVSQRKRGNNRNTDDDVAYILDIFRQEGNVELGITAQGIHDAYWKGAIDMINMSTKHQMTQALRQHRRHRVRPFSGPGNASRRDTANPGGWTGGASTKKTSGVL